MIGSRTLRVLLCVLALTVGAGLAELRAASLNPPRARAASPTSTPVIPADAAAMRGPAHARVVATHSTAVAAKPALETTVEVGREPHSGLGVRFRDGAIITGSTPHRLILFTFDDGPDRRTTPLLLDRLDEAGVHAVFFLVANRMAEGTPTERQEAAVAREIVRRGHLVGNHTLEHAQLPLLDEAAALHQVIAAEKIFERVFGARPYLFRPPFGAHSPRIDRLLAARGYTTLLWNLGSGDFQVRSADEVFETWRKVFERRELEHGDRGGVILLHDTYAWSVDAFQRIVSYLRTRNCELLAQGEELFDLVDDPALFFVPRADGPADMVAPALELPAEVLEARQAKLRAVETMRCRMLGSGG